MKKTYQIILVLSIVVCQNIYIEAQTFDEILAVRQSIFDSLNAHNLDPVMQYYADDFIAEHSWETSTRDRSGYKSGWESIFTAFPDEEYFQGKILVKDGVLVEEQSLQGTQMGEWSGLPPTGEKGEPVHYLNAWDYQGNQMKHLLMYMDMQTVLVGAKVMPVTELPPLVPSFQIPDPEPTGLSPVDAYEEASNRWNNHDLASWSKMFTKDADIYINVPGTPMTREEMIAIFEINFTGFPDVQMEEVRLEDFGDGWIYTESLFHGTNKGPWFGIPPTGKIYQGLRVGQVLHYNTDGLCDYSHAYYDNITVLAQLGLFGPSSAADWEVYQ